MRLSYETGCDQHFFNVDGLWSKKQPTLPWESWGQILHRRDVESLVSLVENDFNSSKAKESISFLLQYTRTLLLDVVALALSPDEEAKEVEARLGCRHQTWRANELRHWITNFSFIACNMPSLANMILRFCELEDSGTAMNNRNWVPLADVEDNMKVIFEWDQDSEDFKVLRGVEGNLSLAQSKTMDRVVCMRRNMAKR
ncbi:hypothetical protein DL98DRAFT_605658 [Cadophora sp. DSE1049]|nr:hypothetical protein DL98DRAFT_605658 [Cadophora sp. DSE1049]